MDNLTHTLTGILLSRAGLGRSVPRATLIIALAANIPDIDTVAWLGGSHVYLDWHRGPTHGFPALPLMAVLPVLAVGFVRPRGFPWLRAWLVSLAGVLSHILMDWTNIYGVRLLAPLATGWFRLDCVSVIDPWIWLVLLLAVLWPLLARLVSSEIGARRPTGSGIARAALLAIVLYDFGRWMLHARAVEILNAHLFGGRTPRRVMAMPAFANPFRWYAVVDMGDHWRTQVFDVRRSFDPDLSRAFYHAEPSPAIEAARLTPPFRSIERFSNTLHWQVLSHPEPEGSWEVTATDMRFAQPGEGRFAARALVDPAGQVLESEFRFAPPGRTPRPR